MSLDATTPGAATQTPLPSESLEKTPGRTPEDEHLDGLGFAKVGDGTAAPETDSETDEQIAAIAAARQIKRPPAKYDENGLLVVEVAPGKIAYLKELDGFQSIRADVLLGQAPTPMLICKIYALFSLKRLTVKGEERVIPPAKDDQNIYKRAQLFSARELLILMDSYEAAFMQDPMAGEGSVKN